MEPVKGLEVARQFFQEWGLPFLEREFPDYGSRMAAGRLLGSDLLGGDDDVSRDHNWGPQFFLFLTASDYQNIGRALSDRINAVAPNPWRGFHLAGKGNQSVVVVAIPTFFEKMMDLETMPQSAQDWSPALIEHESDLYFIRHGAIFHDPLGELSAWRAALHEYPYHLRMRRLSEECDRIWHRGEYNFVQRMAYRDDPLTNQICLAQFADAVMQLYLLLSGDFTPYWKWLPQEFRKSPYSPEVEPLLVRLASPQPKQAQIELVKQVCAIVHKRLIAAGVITGRIVNPNSLPLENARHELRAQSKIIRPFS